MNEIELKFKVKEYDNLLNNLKKLGCTFEKKVCQKDVVYYEKTNKNFDIVPGTTVIRTRIIDNNRKYVTLKTRANDIAACREIEFEVENSAKIEDFIESLGYKKIVSFSKTRYKTSYNDFNICIDSVEELGDYIEIEILTESNDIQLFKNKILNFAKQLEINLEDLESRYYPVIVMEKRKVKK